VSMPLAAVHLADGPAMYFGGTIMTFALPMGAFIVITVALFYLFRSEHSGPRLKYLTTAPFTSVGTRQPGPVQAPPMIATATVAEAERQATEDPETTFDQETAETAPPEATAGPGTTGVTGEPEEQ
jgi:hypothetical protein